MIMESVKDMVEETRFKERVEDPFGEWEHSPDGENILIFKVPSAWDAQARWAKRIKTKFGVSMKEAYLLSYCIEIVGRSPEVEAYYESLIESVGFDQAFKEARKLALELNKLGGHWSPRSYKRDLECWVPLPLEEDEGEKPSLSQEEKMFHRLWDAIDRWNNTAKASRGMMGLWQCKELKNLPYAEASRIWEKARSRKKKLLAYKELASRKVLGHFLEAKKKCAQGLGTQERIEAWVSRLPLSEETRQWVKEELIKTVESHKRLSTVLERGENEI